MSNAFKSAVAEAAPHAQVVFDRQHGERDGLCERATVRLVVGHTDDWKLDVWRHCAYGADAERFAAYRTAAQRYASFFDRGLLDALLGDQWISETEEGSSCHPSSAAVWSAIETADFGIGPHYALVENARVLLPKAGVLGRDLPLHHEFFEMLGQYILAPTHFGKPGPMLWAQDDELERFIADLRKDPLELEVNALAHDILDNGLDSSSVDDDDDGPVPDSQEVAALAQRWRSELEASFETFLGGCQRVLEARQVLVCWDER